jgi:hypothetical protein
MIDALRFVKGAVAKKDFQPVLTHFRITNGRVTGFNGILALSSPIPLDLTATPAAIPFVKAIEGCSDQVVLYMTEAKRLAVKSGSFKAYINCSDDGEMLDAIKPEGRGCMLPGVIINAFKALEPFIGYDASRPWANGILLRGQCAYATNNIIVAQVWVGQELPEMNIPDLAIRELIRIGEEPLACTLGKNNITFHFNEDRWMRSQLLNTNWPNIDRLLDSVEELGPEFGPLPTGIFESVEKLKPFLSDEGRIYFRKDTLSTAIADGEGASVTLPGIPEYGAYHYEHLMSLKGIAEKIDFSKHPKPCPFRGPMLRGVIQGMRDA